MVNGFGCEMEEGPGRAGFWFRAGELGARLGAARMGATVYEARDGMPIWPYHYHYLDEEWLYVLDGSPVLRSTGGRRVLAGGDVVCFPAGHRGAHTLEGPGRFVLFSGERLSGPFVSVYPDSDKVSLSPGIEAGDLNALRLLRAGSVDYWHGEGHGPLAATSVARESEDVLGPPVVNVRDLAFEQGEGWRWGALGEAIGAQCLDGAVLELAPQADFGPYRYEYGREMWLLVLAGTPSLQHAVGEMSLAAGDLTCLPEGPAGGRRPFNRSDEMARVLLLWTTGFPSVICYPESDEWVLRPARGADTIRLR